MKIKTYTEMKRANIYIYMYASYLSFFFDSMSCFSFSQYIAPSHAQHIYVYKYIYKFVLGLYTDLLAGDQVRIHICLFVRLFFFLLSFFFFLRTMHNLSNIKLYYVYIYIQCIYTVS
jgi:hypothetical protein